MIWVLIVSLAASFVTGEEHACAIGVEGASSLYMTNGFVNLNVDLLSGAITSLTGDFKGESNWGVNVLGSQGLRLLRIDSQNAEHGFSGHTPLPYHITSSFSEQVSVQLNVTEDSGSVVEIWELTLNRGDRNLHYTAKGGACQTSPTQYQGCYSVHQYLPGLHISLLLSW